MSDEPQTFAEFWPLYLRAHPTRGTRAMHYFGTSLAIMLVLCFIAGGGWWSLVAAPIAGYAPAWFAHFVLARNRPATFGHPFWSLAGDFRMLYLAATGRLGPELARAGLG